MININVNDIITSFFNGLDYLQINKLNFINDKIYTDTIWIQNNDINYSQDFENIIDKFNNLQIDSCETLIISSMKYINKVHIKYATRVILLNQYNSNENFDEFYKYIDNFAICIIYSNVNISLNRDNLINNNIITIFDVLC